MGFDGPNYTPKDIRRGSCKAWYRSDLGAAPAQWDDQSGNAAHLLQATASLRPTVVAGRNRRPEVLLDGTDDYMEAAFTLTPPCTIVAAYRSVTIQAATNHDIVLSCPANLGTLISDTTPQLVTSAGGASPPTYAALVANTTYAVVTCILNGASSFLRVLAPNCSTAQQVASGDAGSTAMGGIRLGYVVAGRTAQAGFQQLACYNVALTPRELAAVEKYFRAWSAI